MLGNRAYVVAVEIKMAQATVLAIANQQKRLVIADVKRKPVAAIQLAVATAHFRVTRFIVSILVETKDARITIAIGNKDGPIRGGHSRGNPPFIGGLEAGLWRSGNFQEDSTIGLHL